MSYMVAIHSNWMTMFQDFKFSTQEFYATVEKHLMRRGIPNVRYGRIHLKEGGLFSSSREYLRVAYEDLGFDICAAPFGNDFFVSWWFGNVSSIGKDISGKLFGRLASGKITYFRLDTNGMFKESVRMAVLSAIDEITEMKGVRSLSESQRKEVELV